MKTHQFSNKLESSITQQDFRGCKQSKKSNQYQSSQIQKISSDSLNENIKPKLKHYKVVEKYIQLEKKFGIKSKSIGIFDNYFRGWK